MLEPYRSFERARFFSEKEIELFELTADGADGRLFLLSSILLFFEDKVVEEEAEAEEVEVNNDGFGMELSEGLGFFLKTNIPITTKRATAANTEVAMEIIVVNESEFIFEMLTGTANDEGVGEIAADKAITCMNLTGNNDSVLNLYIDTS
jgi:hypothetical protein